MTDQEKIELYCHSRANMALLIGKLTGCLMQMRLILKDKNLSDHLDKDTLRVMVDAILTEAMPILNREFYGNSLEENYEAWTSSPVTDPTE